MNLISILNNTAIQCDTEEKAKILLAALRKCGYNWEYGENVTNWETYEGETCYFIKNKEIIYHARASLKNLTFYRNIYNVVSFDDIVFAIQENEKSVSEVTVTLTQEQLEKIRQEIIELERNSLKSQFVTRLERASYQVTYGDTPIEVIRKDKIMEIVNQLLS